MAKRMRRAASPGMARGQRLADGDDLDLRWRDHETTTLDPGDSGGAHHRAVPPGDNVYTMADGSPCRPEGDNSRPALIALDLQKNRAAAPRPEDIDPGVTLAAILAPSTDIDRFDATRGATVEGIVVRVKAGSIESCNCHATNAIDQDTHIELALSGAALPNQRVVVEVTPRIRKQQKAAGQDWSTRAFQGEDGNDGIVGKWVRVTGWLFFDEIHLKAAENTNPGGAQRACHVLGDSSGDGARGLECPAGRRP